MELILASLILNLVTEKPEKSRKQDSSSKNVSMHVICIAVNDILQVENLPEEKKIIKLSYLSVLF